MTELDPRRELALLLLLTAVMFITIVDFMVLMPLSPYLMLQFHVTPARFGFLVSAYSLAAVAGVPLGLFLAEHQGWRAPFAALAVLSALVWLAVWRQVPPVRGHLTQSPTGLWQGYRELLAVPNHWWACGVTALTMLSGFSVIPYISPTQVANVGLDPHYLAWIYLVGGGATLFTRPVIGRLADRYRQAHVFSVLVILSFIPIVLVTQTLQLSFAWQLLFTTLFFIFVSGRFIPASALVTGATEARLRGRLMAFNSAVQNFASGIAAFVAGLMMSQGPRGELLGFGWVGLMSCVFGLVAIWVAYRVKAVA
ncbi:MFS transporter [Chitinolyticbacter meiyuanensis]|uniref:MFS transporter n=1 Tax=Chitinolyticbacter meiyuanensis TaxID=682798 RepID=UPI0011E5A43A|nr:MFS transporter [Chitinolyticbacter meiyuanensis]